MTRLHHGFLDESGILEKKAKTGNCFIISVVIIANPSELKRVIKLARRKAKGKFKTHRIFKAQKENKVFVKLVLRELAKRDITVVIGVWDKKRRGAEKDKNILYAKLLAQTLDTTLSIYPRLDLVIHKRYTLPKIRNQVSQTINNIIKSGQFLSLEHKSEVECRELELADAVAWAVFQKYNNNNPEFYEIIREKIVKENRLAA